MQKQCTVITCDRSLEALDYCKMHLKRFKRNGSPERVRRTFLKGSGDTPEDRFWCRVSRGDMDKCWEWQGYTSALGYGVVWCEGKLRKAHRAAWFYLHGVFPVKCLLHKCDNPKCVNPHHLFEGTVAENNQDKVLKNRQSKGVRSNRTHLKDSDIRAIRNRYQPRKITHQMLATEFHISTRTVYEIVKRRGWKHIT